jgi:transposase InsO family protein
VHLDYPFAGSRMLRELLRGEGIAVGRELVVTMMRRRRIEALYRRPNASKPADGHKIYPYLLRGLAVERPNQVWAMDITFIPMARGFVYLAAVVDWFSRRVLAWRLSIPMETSTTCRGSRQHECAAVVWASLRSGCASRGAPTTAMLQYQPAEAPLIVGCTSYCWVSSASVFSPLMAAKATLALNAGAWVRRARLHGVS